jgi:hypothetical protein
MIGTEPGADGSAPNAARLDAAANLLKPAAEGSAGAGTR